MEAQLFILVTKLLISVEAECLTYFMKDEEDYEDRASPSYSVTLRIPLQLAVDLLDCLSSSSR